MTVQVCFTNASTVVNDETCALIVEALQIQVKRDFFPVWGIDADLRFGGKSGRNPGEWSIVFLDDADQAGILGYHDLTSDGLPMGKVFAGTDLKYGSAIGVTASHELLELLADPSANLTVFQESEQVLYAYEACDACEGDQFGYEIGNVRVSDFVYPSWFEGFHEEGSTKFDHMGFIRNPFRLLPGGYISVFDLAKGSWMQRTAERVNYRARPPVGSRRERRTLPRNQWLLSVA